MVNHFCSQCGKFSQQRDALTFAVTCPACGHVEPNNPHTPDIPTAAELAAKSGHVALGAPTGRAEARGTIVVSSSTRRRRAAAPVDEAPVEDQPKSDGGKLTAERAAEITAAANP